MNKNLSSKGFTLIELLVVVAIIAILSGIVLVTLNGARSKAKDARIQAELQQLKSQMELYYSSNANGYGTATDCTSGTGNPFVGTANNAAGTLITAIDADNGAGTVRCGASASAWAVSAALVSNPSSSWCVDSNGGSTTTTTTNGAVSC